MIKDVKLTDRSYTDMSLAELLETRDKIIANKASIHRRENGKELYKYAMGRLQEFIYMRRTVRKSGLIIPYNKDITTD